MDSGRSDGPSIRGRTYSLMAARISQEGIEGLQIPGTANARITQETLEALDIPLRSGVNARITQQTLEGFQIPVRAATNARITQQAIEFLYIPGVFGAASTTEDFYYYQEGITPY